MSLSYERADLSVQTADSVPGLPAGEPNKFRQLEPGHSPTIGRFATYRKSKML